MTSAELACWPLVGVAVVTAAIFDWRTRKIPPALSWVLLAGCLGLRLALQGAGSADSGLVTGLLGAVGCAAPWALLALTGPRVGWGDVLLLAGVGAGLGFPRALAAAFLISVVGAAAALLALWRRRSLPIPAPGAHASVDSARAIPYGLPIALGAIWAMGWAGPELGPDEGGALEQTIELLDAGVEASPDGTTGAAPELE